MLLWIGAILCLLAYGIQAAYESEPVHDNVRTDVQYLPITLYLLKQYLRYSLGLLLGAVCKNGLFSVLSVVSGCCTHCSRHHHWLFLLLPRG